MPNRLRRARRRFTTALIGTTLLLGAAIPAALAQGDTVSITSSLEPASLEVVPGTTVTWRNDDAERHRIRSREGPERFDSGNLEPGESFTFTFALPGTYPYIDPRDDENPAYFGTVVVTASPGGTTASGELRTSGTVTIGDRVFIPPTVEIATGGTVEWTNTDSDSHTATASGGAFDSGILAPGATFMQTFASAGSFPFFCEIHPEMQGTITVSDPVAAASPSVDAASSPSVADAATSPAPSPGARSSAPSPAASPAPTEVASPVPSDSPDPASGDANAAVTVADRAFDPTTVEVPVGGSVDWSNLDEEGHTVTAMDGSFDSGVVGPGEGFSATFVVPGSFDYFCAIHPEMQASVVVTDGEVPASGTAGSGPGAL